MRFGLYLNPSTPGPEHDGRRIQEVLRQCQLVESLGFSSIWLTEQHFTPYNTYSDSLVLASHLAALTPSMLLGFAVVVPTLHHPVRLAEQISLLDQLCCGRLVVGLGSGAGALELAGFGQEYSERHADFEEVADLLRRLWLHEDGILDYETARYRGRIEGRVIPRPVQQPYPMLARATGDADRVEAWGALGQPVLLGSRGSEWLGTMVEAHERGLARAPIDEARREALRDVRAIHHVVYVAESDEAAHREFLPIWDRHLVNHNYANRSVFLPRDQLPPDAVATYTERQLICGSPETVIAVLRQYEAVGIRHHMVWANVGDAPAEMVERSLRLFAERVMPAFQ